MSGLKDPLAAARAIATLADELEKQDLKVEIATDFERFNQIKIAAREKPLCPLFDPTVNDFSNDRAFWMSLSNGAGETLAIQSFRNDKVETSLADWCLPYMIGLYVRRQELLVPTQAQPPEGSISRRLRGSLVYHGELWAYRQLRPRTLSDTFSKLGMLLAYVKWQPDALWGLVSNSMANAGLPQRLGYPYMERGFLRWQWVSDGMDEVEFLCVADRDAMEQYLHQGDAVSSTIGRNTSTASVHLAAAAE
jgi:hypothetical protein